jgi:hypothetical protein
VAVAVTHLYHPHDDADYREAEAWGTGLEEEEDMAIKSVSDVRAERDRLEHQVDAFLRSAGWNHTSATPGCHWMWERVIDGRRILVEKDMALSVQAHLDAPSDDEPVSA